MKIIKVLMNKKLENQEMFSLYRRRQFSYEEHISAYLHALFYLGIYDPLLEKKIKLWSRYLVSTGKNRLKYYRRLLKFRNDENKIILEAFNKIEEEKLSGNIGFGSLWQKYTIGVLSYEFEANE